MSSESEFEVITGPVVQETDRTLRGAPVIRVDGFEFVGDNEFRTEDPEASHWLSDLKQVYVHRGRLYVRIDQTDAFLQYFRLGPYAVARKCTCSQALSGGACAATKD